ADSGSWGAWSPWSACTSTCGGGTRNRYRFCDSPPPRYGAKFCEGSSLETMRCGPDNEWDCAPEGVSADLPLGVPAPVPARPAPGRPEPAQGCRCGCVVHLGTTKPATLLASSSKSCPGRSFWLV
ncbi:Thrombospondin-2, partial [Frankliniella fusca]